MQQRGELLVRRAAGGGDLTRRDSKFRNRLGHGCDPVVNTKDRAEASSAHKAQAFGSRTRLVIRGEGEAGQGAILMNALAMDAVPRDREKSGAIGRVRKELLEVRVRKVRRGLELLFRDGGKLGDVVKVRVGLAVAVEAGGAVAAVESGPKKLVQHLASRSVGDRVAPEPRGFVHGGRMLR